MLLSNAADQLDEVAEGGGLTISGPMIVAEFELFGIPFVITESITVQWLVMLFLGILFFVLGRNLKIIPEGKRQAAAEMLVGTFVNLIKSNMGEKYYRLTPYIATLFMFSALNSLSCFLGFRSPTADVSVILAWGLITFFLVQYNRYKTGGFLRGFLNFINPLNIISEFSNPMSQSFRHFGNIMAGFIISSIIYWALGSFAIIVPAVASLYFDLFSSVMHAFIFITLTMVYITNADLTKPEKNS